MSGILARIRSIRESLPEAEKRVAEYVLSNSENAPRCSVHEFARGASVSVASVSRFVRRAGYGHFRDFKVELARETASTLTGLYRAITPKDSDAEIVRKVFLGNLRSLEDTLKILSVPELVRAAQAICAADRLVFFGMGGSGVVAHDAALRFSYLDFQADSFSDASEILLQALRVGKRDVAVGISHSGRSSITVEGLRMARRRGVFTIGVSNYLRSPLREHSTVFFCTAFPENKVKVAALSSRVAQLCLLDAVYLVVAHHKNQLWDVDQVNALTERMLRLPARSPRSRRNGKER